MEAGSSLDSLPYLNWLTGHGKNTDGNYIQDGSRRKEKKPGASIDILAKSRI
jgi:hypothetical protein